MRIGCRTGQSHPRRNGHRRMAMRGREAESVRRPRPARARADEPDHQRPRRNARMAATIKVSIEACGRFGIGQPALRIRVADEGNGIPQDIVDKVTEPFFTTKETGKGTGLGLSMVAGFVHQSGGKLEIASAPGKGTAIDLILPATEAPRRKEDKGLARLVFDKRLLLIDDDDAVRMVLSEQFRDAGGNRRRFACGRGGDRCGQESAIELRSRPQRFRNARDRWPRNARRDRQTGADRAHGVNDRLRRGSTAVRGSKSRSSASRSICGKSRQSLHRDWGVSPPSSGSE